MRRLLDDLLAAPGLTRARFAVLALVSLASTAVVLAAGAPERHVPWDLVAAAQERPAPVVDVTRRAQPAVADDPAPSGPAPSGPAPAAAPADDTVAADPVPVSAPVETTTDTTPVQTPTTETTTPAPAKPVSKVGHVFVVAAPAASLDPYKPQGRLLEGYKLLDKGPLATEVALVSGQQATPGIEQGCPTYGGDCIFPVETLTLADQFTSKGQRWRAYIEGMPQACTHPNIDSPDQPTADYATQRNPFVYFHSLTELGDCQSNDLPLDSLATDLATADATPNFSYIVPKPGDATSDDAFVANWVPQILSSAAYKADGLLILLTDNGALLVSQFATPGSSSQTPYDAFGVLRSIEDLFGFDDLGAAAGPTATSFATTEVAAGLS